MIFVLISFAISVITTIKIRKNVLALKSITIQRLRTANIVGITLVSIGIVIVLFSEISGVISLQSYSNEINLIIYISFIIIETIIMLLLLFWHIKNKKKLENAVYNCTSCDITASSYYTKSIEHDVTKEDYEKTENTLQSNNTIIYKSINIKFIYIVIEIILIILFVIGIYNVLNNISNAMSWLEYKIGLSSITSVYAEDYHITYNKWNIVDGASYANQMFFGMILVATSLLLTIINLKILKNARKNIVHIGTNYIEAWNHKEHIIADYDKEIIVAVKNIFTITIATQNNRMDISHLLSVYNIVKIANRTIELKRER